MNAYHILVRRGFTDRIFYVLLPGELPLDIVEAAHLIMMNTDPSEFVKDKIGLGYRTASHSLADIREFLRDYPIDTRLEEPVGWVNFKEIRENTALKFPSKLWPTQITDSEIPVFLGQQKGPGSATYRFTELMAELEKRFPHQNPFDSTKMPETYLLEEIDRLIWDAKNIFATNAKTAIQIENYKERVEQLEYTLNRIKDVLHDNPTE